MGNFTLLPDSGLTTLCRLVGTKGATAAIGTALKIEDDHVLWQLDPVYAAWFWPLMLKATQLTLRVPLRLLEPMEDGDCIEAPRRPTEEEKDALLKVQEQPDNAIQVYTLALKGKPVSVQKAFPTRTVNLDSLRYCRIRVGDDAAN